jgi:hypothetical protein
MTACRDTPRTLILFSRLRAVLIAPKAFSVRVLDMIRDRGESAGARLAGRLGGVVDWYCRRYEDDQPGGAICADGCIRGAVIA